MIYIRHKTTRNRTHNLFCPKCALIPLGHSDGNASQQSTPVADLLQNFMCWDNFDANLELKNFISVGQPTNSVYGCFYWVSGGLPRRFSAKSWWSQLPEKQNRSFSTLCCEDSVKASKSINNNKYYLIFQMFFKYLNQHYIGVANRPTNQQTVVLFVATGCISFQRHRQFCHEDSSTLFTNYVVWTGKQPRRLDR